MLSSLLIIHRYVDIEFYGQELIDKWIEELTHLVMDQKLYQNLYKNMNLAGMLSEEFKESEKKYLLNNSAKQAIDETNKEHQQLERRIQLLENKNSEMQKLLEQAFGQIAILELKLKEKTV